MLPIPASCHHSQEHMTSWLTPPLLLLIPSSRFWYRVSIWKMIFKTPRLQYCGFINLSKLLALPSEEWKVVVTELINDHVSLFSRCTHAAAIVTTQWSSSWPRNTTWRTWGPSTGWTGSPQASSCLAGNSISGLAWSKCAYI